MDCDAAASVLAEAMLAVSAFAEDGLVAEDGLAAEDGLDPDAVRAGSTCDRTRVSSWLGDLMRPKAKCPMVSSCSV